MSCRVMVGVGGACDLGYHVVWCPKYRPSRPVPSGPDRGRLDVLIRGRCAECDWPVVALGIEPDRVHLFVEAHPEHSPSYIAHQVMGFTSYVLCGEFPHLRSRLPALWSWPCFVATVGAVSAGTVRR
ncbi:IS200/IS605 family transposase [Frankia gtarii]|uniref:IS200/IS605 family transposase n=1 Tax=Frankia gtarii TaxID=2950102 RepID=UPI0021C1B1E2|nr:IS200/IS605 family transposase [Frankia gtarii]